MMKLMLGDCCEGMKALESKTVDLLVTDPPYGIGFTGKEGFYGVRNKELVVDYIEQDDYWEFTARWVKEACRLLKDDASAYVVSGWTNLEAILKAFRENGMILTNHVIWKFPFGVYCKKKYVTSHYHVLFYRKNEKKFTWNAEPYTLDVWEHPRDRKVKFANSLPLKIVSKMILHASNPGDLVLDPFLGSGTTALACKMLDRDFVGFEISERAYKIARKRISRGGLF